MADADQAALGKPPGKSHAPLWLRELPYGIVLLLTLLGIAYTSLTRQPIALSTGSSWYPSSPSSAWSRDGTTLPTGKPE